MIRRLKRQTKRYRSARATQPYPVMMVVDLSELRMHAGLLQPGGILYNIEPPMIVHGGSSMRTVPAPRVRGRKGRRVAR